MSVESLLINSLVEGGVTGLVIVIGVKIILPKLDKIEAGIDFIKGIVVAKCQNR